MKNMCNETFLEFLEAERFVLKFLLTGLFRSQEA